MGMTSDTNLVNMHGGEHQLFWLPRKATPLLPGSALRLYYNHVTDPTFLARIIV